MSFFFCISGAVYYTQRSAWIATGVVFAAILPILMCIICAVYCYRKKARKVDPNWTMMSLPRSRAGSRTTLRHLASDGSEVDSDTLKKSRSYEGEVYLTHEPLGKKANSEFPEKKWDLDEEDITSSEGGSEFPQGKIAKDINYIGTPIDDVPAQQPRQIGRRQQQQQQQQPQPSTIQEAESPSGFSPQYSGFGGGAQNRPTGGIRVMPPGNKFFTDNTGSPESSGSPVLTQNIGLPSPPLNNRSTEV